MAWLTDDKFANARGKGVSWIEVAANFAAGLEAASKDGEASRTRYQKDAARHTGYTIGMLRNMAATYEWIRRSRPHRAIPEAVVAKSLTALDLIRRLDAHDPGLADRYLSRLDTATGVRVSALRAELRDIARKTETPGGDGPQEEFKEIVEPGFVSAPATLVIRRIKPSLAQMRSWRSMEAMDDITKLLPIISGEVFVFGRPDGVSPIGVRASAIAWLDADMTTGDAFEVVNAGHGLNRATLSDHVSRAIASSRFFRQHFLAFTSDSEPELVFKATESVTALKVPALGVLWFGYKGKEAILLKPAGPPAPDCRDRLKEVCKRGHWQ
ncbi:hypothetical protein [Bradyrhizobium elkanii]|uniref:hypothetical protein n=1 Tax=Bradyrhizobium elkanii TaxID=29448 RepID=UPI000570395B|nr:hypothetical protein [Bradyrhizobium elkanii]WLA83222.1 hypothetical protein QNJ99_02445 [Bradyrhizobium elkanii]